MERQDDSRLMDVGEAADMLGLTVAGLRQRISRGGAAPRPILLGRSQRWRKADVLSWIEQLAAESGANYSSRPVAEKKEEPARRKRGRPRKDSTG